MLAIAALAFCRGSSLGCCLSLGALSTDSQNGLQRRERRAGHVSIVVARTSIKKSFRAGFVDPLRVILVDLQNLLGQVNSTMLFGQLASALENVLHVVIRFRVGERLQ